jgi:HTH-type transcriptional regulator / antitoxin HigA
MNSTPENQYNPDSIAPPGDTLKELLEEHGMAQSELAERMGRPKKTINEIIKGKTVITSDTALQLERIFGVPARFWLNLEQNYQEFLAREREKEKLSEHIDWLNNFPVLEMVKLGWIEKRSKKLDQLVEVLNFFGVRSPTEWEAYWKNRVVFYRKFDADSSSKFAITAWLRKGEVDAQAIACQPYSSDHFRDALDEVRKLTAEPPGVFVPKLRQLCANAGVAVVFLPGLPKMRVSGAMRWLTQDKALIQLSLLYKSNDHLWFTFFHEAQHVLQERKRDLVLEGTDNSDVSDPLEIEANQFSANFLIPDEQYQLFTNSTNKYSKVAIRDFSETIGIAPGIVVGRLQREKHLPPAHCNDLKVYFQWDQLSES